MLLAEANDLLYSWTSTPQQNRLANISYWLTGLAVLTGLWFEVWFLRTLFSSYQDDAEEEEVDDEDDDDDDDRDKVSILTSYLKCLILTR